MPSFSMGTGDDHLVHLVRSSVAQGVDLSEATRLDVTVWYLLHLRELGVSTAVAQHGLSGIRFHFKLLRWSDVTKLFLIHQALKGWRKEYISREWRRPVSYALLAHLLKVMLEQCSF